MPSNVDERIVRMKFDNSDFISKAKQTSKELDKLNEEFKFDDVKKNVEDLEKSLGKFKLDDFNKTFDDSGKQVSAWTIAIGTALGNLITDIGRSIADMESLLSLSIEGAKAGMQEYEELINKTMVIMNNTGHSVDEVNDYFDTLNEYADLTIYKFRDMTMAAQRFAVAGEKDLDKTKAMIMGIGNAAAYSGLTAEQASSAFSTSSKIMQMGFVNLRQYYSLINSGFFNAKMRESAIQLAEQAGLLKQISDGVWETTNKTAKAGMEVTDQSFMQALGTAKWLRSEIYEQVIAMYSDTTTELGKMAADAATVQKTWTQVIDVAKEQIQTGWAQTWRIFIGNYVEASKMFTAFGKRIDDALAEISDSRNKLLEDVLGARFSISEYLLDDESLDETSRAVKQLYLDLYNGEREWITSTKEDGLTYREMLIQSLIEAFDNLKTIVDAIAKGWKEAFPEYVPGILQELIRKIYAFAASLKPSEERLQLITTTVKNVLTVLRTAKKIISDFFSAIFGRAAEILDLDTSLEGVLNKINETAIAIANWLKNSVDLSSVARLLGDIIGFFAKAIKTGLEAIKDLYDFLAPIFAPYIKRFFGYLGDYLPKLNAWLETYIPNAVTKTKEFLETINFQKAIETCGKFFNILMAGVDFIISHLFNGADIKKATNAGETIGEAFVSGVSEATASGELAGVGPGGKISPINFMDGLVTDRPQEEMRSSTAIARIICDCLKEICYIIYDTINLVYHELVLPAFEWIKIQFAPGGLVSKAIGWILGATGILALVGAFKIVLDAGLALIKAVTSVARAIGGLGSIVNNLNKKLVVLNFKETVKSISILVFDVLAIIAASYLITKVGVDPIVEGFSFIVLIGGILFGAITSLMKMQSNANVAKIASISGILFVVGILLGSFKTMIAVMSLIPVEKMGHIEKILLIVLGGIAVILGIVLAFLGKKSSSSGGRGNVSITGVKKISILENLKSLANVKIGSDVMAFGVLIGGISLMVKMVIDCLIAMKDLQPNQIDWSIKLLAALAFFIGLLFGFVKNTTVGLKDTSMLDIGKITATALFVVVIGKAIKKMLKAITDLATHTNDGNIISLSVTLGAVAVLLVELFAFIKSLLKSDMSKSNPKGVRSAIKLIVVLCVGISGIIRAVALLAKLNPNTGAVIAVTLSAIIILAAISEITTKLSKLDKGIPFSVIASVMIIVMMISEIIFAMTPLIAATALSKPGSILAAMAGIAAVITIILAFVTKINATAKNGDVADTGKIAGLASTIFAIGIALSIIFKSIGTLLGKVTANNYGLVHQVLTYAILLVAELAIVASSLSKSKDLGGNNNIVGAIATIIFMCKGLSQILIAMTVLLAAGASEAQIGVATLAMIALAATVAIIAGELAKVKPIPASVIVSIATMLTCMSLLMDVMAVVIAASALSSWDKILSVFGGVVLVLIAAATALRIIPTSVNVTGILAMGLVIDMLAVSLAILAGIPFEQLGAGAAALTIMVSAIVILLTVVNALKLDPVKLGAVVTVIASMAGVFLLLAIALSIFQLTDWSAIGKGLAVFGVMIVTLVALGALVYACPAIILGIERIAKAINKASIGFAAFAAAIALVAIAIPLLAGAFATARLIELVAMAAANLVITFAVSFSENLVKAAPTIAKNILLAIFKVIDVLGRYSNVIVKVIWNFLIDILISVGELIGELLITLIRLIPGVDELFGPKLQQGFNAACKAMEKDAKNWKFNISNEFTAVTSSISGTTNSLFNLEGKLDAFADKYVGKNFGMTYSLEEQTGKNSPQYNVMEAANKELQTLKDRYDEYLDHYAPTDPVMIELTDKMADLSEFIGAWEYNYNNVMSESEQDKFLKLYLRSFDYEGSLAAQIASDNATAEREAYEHDLEVYKAALQATVDSGVWQNNIDIIVYNNTRFDAHNLQPGGNGYDSYTPVGLTVDADVHADWSTGKNYNVTTHTYNTNN